VLAGGGWLLFPRTVEVDVQSSPTAAAIHLDGKAIGMTPLRLKLPNPPQGSLTLLLPGYQPYRHQLESRDRSLSCTLQAVPPPPEPTVSSESPTPTAIPRAKSRKRFEAQTPPKSDIFDQLRKQKE